MSTIFFPSNQNSFTKSLQIIIPLKNGKTYISHASPCLVIKDILILKWCFNDIYPIVFSFLISSSHQSLKEESLHQNKEGVRTKLFHEYMYSDLFNMKLKKCV